MVKKFRIIEIAKPKVGIDINTEEREFFTGCPLYKYAENKYFYKVQRKILFIWISWGYYVSLDDAKKGIEHMKNRKRKNVIVYSE